MIGITRAETFWLWHQNHNYSQYHVHWDRERSALYTRRTFHREHTLPLNWSLT